jgi:predicted NBD/HSP70 family sugar kinase
MEWLDEASEQMAFVLLAVEYLLDPGAIFIGGRWPNALLKALLDRASVRLSDQRIAGKRSVPDLRLAMAGTDAAALGVATLPLYSTFAPRSPITLKRADSGEAMANRPL